MVNESNETFSNDFYKVDVKNYRREFKRFQFYVYGRSGKCFLRIWVEDGTPNFFCAQLINYRGKSITNAVEYILAEAINYLIKEKIVLSIRKKSFFDYFFKKNFLRKTENDIFSFFAHEAKWIEHYPPDTGLVPGGSYALVTFDDSFNPSWNYATREDLEKFVGIGQDFFDVSHDDLVLADDEN
ncbi:MAG: hypothetical protein ACYCQM_10965 [Acidithiobacillus sp.]